MMVFDTLSASENNNMSASDFDASITDMMSVGGNGVYDGDGYYYYGSGGEDNDDDDDDNSNSNNSTDDPRYHLFRLMDQYCSLNNNNNSNWEPIRDWLETMMPSSSKDTDEDVIVSDNDDDDENDDDNENSMILRAAVLEARERSGQTVLHVACERSVPIDIVEILLSIVDRYKYKYDIEYDIVRCSTIDGWLPLHYACNYPNNYEVVRRLVEAYPESKNRQDLKGRTPLHFSMREENMNRPEVVALLSSASGIADDNGILPLHYACLYGASEDFLRILTDAYLEGVNATDRFGRVPLHYSLSNAGRENAPAAVRLLLGLNPALVNIPGIARTFSGSDAVRKYNRLVLLSSDANYTTTNGDNNNSNNNNNKTNNRHHHHQGGGVGGDGGSTEDFSCKAVEECLQRFLKAKPNPTADFFTALQSLPESLREKAVLIRVVQELLNKKIGQRFPTAILLLDLYLQIIVVVSYTLAVKESVIGRFADADPVTTSTTTSPVTTSSWSCLVWLYIGLSYFLLQEIVQLISLISLKASWIWVYDPGNWLNVIYILYISIWTVFMSTGWCDRDIFRNGASISFFFIWIKFLSYLRNILIDFAVFSGGVFNVLRRLLAFLMCLTIILIAFSRMFFTLFYETEYCTAGRGGADLLSSSSSLSSSPFDDQDFTMALICEANDDVRPWCNAWDSFLAVYTMLLGEVDETVFDDNTTALLLFVVFMLLVVILLANVLIAIVTDSYKVIRDKRAAIEFWTNRLDFIAQMDAISNGPWKTRIRRMLGMTKVDTRFNNVEVTFGKALWNDIIELFEHNIVEDGIFSLDFVICLLLRLIAIVFVPLWILGGGLGVGLLWPPQIREKLFISAVTKHSSESEKEENLRKTQIERLKVEMVVLRDDLLRESAQHRTQILQMKSAIAERKLETRNNLTTIKRNIVLALELCDV